MSIGGGGSLFLVSIGGGGSLFPVSIGGGGSSSLSLSELRRKDLTDQSGINSFSSLRGGSEVFG